MSENDLIIKQGKQYKTRGGDITRPLRLLKNIPKYRFAATLIDHERGFIHSWTERGRYLSYRTHVMDLVEEYLPKTK